MNEPSFLTVEDILFIHEQEIQKQAVIQVFDKNKILKPVRMHRKQVLTRNI
jgi:hypothetical protein